MTIDMLSANPASHKNASSKHISSVENAENQFQKDSESMSQSENYSSEQKDQFKSALDCKLF